MNLTLGDIARRLDLELIGDASIQISGIANVLDAKPDQLTFLFNPNHKKFLSNCQAAAVVLRASDVEGCDLPCLVTPRPRLEWARIAAFFDTSPVPDRQIHSTAVVSPTAMIADDVTIGAQVVIEAGARIGNGASIGAGCFIGVGTIVGTDSRLAPNVVLYHEIVIGDNVIIHSGAVIGADGFGFEPDNGALTKIPQVYGVRIGNNVEIGAGTTIDRGALNHTRIGDGVKLDNQVQIGHGTTIGNDTAISGCTAIAGSTKIGAYCLIGGAVGIVDNIQIADGVEITAMSLVSRSIEEKGRYSSGTGLMPARSWKRNIVGFARLGEILKRLRALERKQP